MREVFMQLQSWNEKSIKINCLSACFLVLTRLHEFFTNDEVAPTTVIVYAGLRAALRTMLYCVHSIS